MRFFDRLELASKKNHSLLCVGLDAELEKLPEIFRDSAEPLFEFNKAIIDATKHLVCAYKPNSAFYEKYGIPGLAQLQKTIDYIPDDIPVILDVKRSDIGNTARAYAQAAFEQMQADAITINPLMGHDSIEPFTAFVDKGVFVLGLTSNSGADDFEKLKVDGLPLYIHIAKKVLTWDVNQNCGLVVGATQGEALSAIREVVPQMWFLVPGIGAQGGDLKTVIKAGSATQANPKLLINVSRNVIYASNGQDFAQAAAQNAAQFRDQINELR